MLVYIAIFCAVLFSLCILFRELFYRRWPGDDDEGIDIDKYEFGPMGYGLQPAMVMRAMEEHDIRD